MVLSYTGGSFASNFGIGTRIYATDPFFGATIQLVSEAVSAIRRVYDDFQAVWSRAVRP